MPFRMAGTRSNKGGTLSSQVIMEDGNESTINDHLRDGHRKGTRGLTDDYLSDLHVTLHQANREPRPEHGHPGQDGNDDSRPGQGQEPARPAKRGKKDRSR